MKLDIHVLVLPVGLLEAKNAQGTGQSWVFKRPMERKMSNQTDKGAIGVNELTCKNVLPH